MKKSSNRLDNFNELCPHLNYLCLTVCKERRKNMGWKPKQEVYTYTREKPGQKACANPSSTWYMSKSNCQTFGELILFQYGKGNLFKISAAPIKRQSYLQSIVIAGHFARTTPHLESPSTTHSTASTTTKPHNRDCLTPPKILRGLVNDVKSQEQK